MQIAAMAGDTNIVTDGIHRGLVEFLIEAGHLSPMEVKEQLQCITSKEAITINKKRNQRILNAVKRFGNGIIDTAEVRLILKDRYNFDTAKIRQNELLNQLDSVLEAATHEVISAGYVFDPKILYLAAKWLEDNYARIDNIHASNPYWINGFGKLQSLLSARDAHAAFIGINNVINYNVTTPNRRLFGFYKARYYKKIDWLGEDFYIGRNGPRFDWSDTRRDVRVHSPLSALWKRYVDDKQQQVNRIISPASENTNHATCHIM